MRVFRPVTGQRLEKLTRAGLGDGADVVNHLLTRHADTVVVNGDGAGGFVKSNADLEFRIALKKGGIGERFKAQFVAGIGGVGYELAQKNLLVAIKGMRHEVKQLLNLCLKTQGLF